MYLECQSLFRWIASFEFFQSDFFHLFVETWNNFPFHFFNWCYSASESCPVCYGVIWAVPAPALSPVGATKSRGVEKDAERGKSPVKMGWKTDFRRQGYIKTAHISASLKRRSNTVMALLTLEFGWGGGSGPISNFLITKPVFMIMSAKCMTAQDYIPLRHTNRKNWSGNNDTSGPKPYNLTSLFHHTKLLL